MACAISATSDTMARWSRVPSNGHGSSAPGTASSLMSRSLMIPSVVTRSCSVATRQSVSSPSAIRASSRRMAGCETPTSCAGLPLAPRSYLT